MEVHTHTHTDDPDMHRGRKKFTHYLWEFLMLFLAVFCGFLAENIREHLIEKERERQYIISMIDDVTRDTVQVSDAYKSNIQRLAGFDSLLKSIHETPYSDSTLKFLYYLNRKYILSRTGFPFTKRTISQLKNAGGLRLIRNQAASDSIIGYDEACERIESQMEITIVPTILDHVAPLAYKIFDMYSLYRFSTIRDFRNSTIQLHLISNDEKIIKEYVNWVYHARGYLVRYTILLKEHMERSYRLISLLKKSYHLE